MIDQSHSGNAGAPLKAMLALAIIWVGGRIFWEASVFAPATVSTGSGIVLGSRITRPEIKSEDSAWALLSAFLPNQAEPKTLLVVSPDQDDTPEMRQATHSPVLQRPPPTPFADVQTDLSLFALAPGFSVEPIERIGSRDDRQSVVLEPMSPAPSNSLKDQRFSAYMWVFARQNPGSSSTSPNLALPLSTASQSPGAQYGGSQAGAIISYRLHGDRKTGLTLFLRGSGALSASGQQEIAIGTTIRPMSAIPVSVHAEQRLGNDAQRNRGTAIYLAGGTGPDRISENLTIETYGQAGYVFGPPGSYFFDAAATVQKHLIGKEERKLTVGGGIWAGGQRGVERLDIGPRVTVHLPIDTASARLSVDWRQRVAGNAFPGSGAAVTFSTGF